MWTGARRPTVTAKLHAVTPLYTASTAYIYRYRHYSAVPEYCSSRSNPGSDCRLRPPQPVEAAAHPGPAGHRSRCPPLEFHWEEVLRSYCRVSTALPAISTATGSVVSDTRVWRICMRTFSENKQLWQRSMTSVRSADKCSMNSCTMYQAGQQLTECGGRRTRVSTLLREISKNVNPARLAGR